MWRAHPQGAEEQTRTCPFCSRSHARERRARRQERIAGRQSQVPLHLRKDVGLPVEVLPEVERKTIRRPAELGLKGRYEHNQLRSEGPRTQPFVWPLVRSAVLRARSTRAMKTTECSRLRTL